MILPDTPVGSVFDLSAVSLASVGVLARSAAMDPPADAWASASQTLDASDASLGAQLRSLESSLGLPSVAPGDRSLETSTARVAKPASARGRVRWVGGRARGRPLARGGVDNDDDDDETDRVSRLGAFVGACHRRYFVERAVCVIGCIQHISTRATLTRRTSRTASTTTSRYSQSEDSAAMDADLVAGYEYLRKFNKLSQAYAAGRFDANSVRRMHASHQASVGREREAATGLWTKFPVYDGLGGGASGGGGGGGGGGGSEPRLRISRPADGNEVVVRGDPLPSYSEDAAGVGGHSPAMEADDGSVDVHLYRPRDEPNGPGAVGLDGDGNDKRDDNGDGGGDDDDDDDGSVLGTRVFSPDKLAQRAARRKAVARLERAKAAAAAAAAGGPRPDPEVAIGPALYVTGQRVG